MVNLLNNYRIQFVYFVIIMSLPILASSGCQDNKVVTDTANPEQVTNAKSVQGSDSNSSQPNTANITKQNDNSASAPIAIDFSDKTTARYLVQEQLLRLNFPSDAIGATKSVEGNIKLKSNGELDKSNSFIQIRMDTLKSDSNYRDRYVNNKTLETDTYKYAKFTPTETVDLNWPLPITETLEFKLIGDMTIKTTTKRLTWIIKCSNNGSTLVGKATTEFTFEDFNLTKPTVMSVVSVEDQIRLELEFEANIVQ